MCFRWKNTLNYFRIGYGCFKYSGYICINDYSVEILYIKKTPKIINTDNSYIQDVVSAIKGWAFNMDCVIPWFILKCSLWLCEFLKVLWHKLHGILSVFVCWFRKCLWALDRVLKVIPHNVQLFRPSSVLTTLLSYSELENWKSMEAFWNRIKIRKN